ncbi:MAG: flotillin-like FloA family protein [Ilumatobacteraceae bacterium]
MTSMWPAGLLRVVVSLFAAMVAWAHLGHAGASTPTQPDDPANRPVYVMHITGTIDLGLAPYVERVVAEAEAADAAALVIRIDTPGGRLDAVLQMRDAILGSHVRTVALVDPTAFSAGALVAIAAEEIHVTPGAVIGAATPVLGGTGEVADEKTISAVRATFEAPAEERGRDPLVAAAMVDTRVAIDGLVSDGELLTLTATEAEAYGYADGRVTRFDDLLDRLGLADRRVVDTSPGLAERLVQWLTNPVLAGLLLLGGFWLIIGDFLSGGLGVAASPSGPARHVLLGTPAGRARRLGGPRVDRTRCGAARGGGLRRPRVRCRRGARPGVDRCRRVPGDDLASSTSSPRTTCGGQDGPWASRSSPRWPASSCWSRCWHAVGRRAGWCSHGSAAARPSTAAPPPAGWPGSVRTTVSSAPTDRHRPTMETDRPARRSSEWWAWRRAICARAASPSSVATGSTSSRRASSCLPARRSRWCATRVSPGGATAGVSGRGSLARGRRRSGAEPMHGGGPEGYRREWTPAPSRSSSSRPPSSRSRSCSSTVPIGLWITAIFSGVRVRISTLIGERLRKVAPAAIIRPLISATKAEIELDIGQMRRTTWPAATPSAS